MLYFCKIVLLNFPSDDTQVFNRWGDKEEQFYKERDNEELETNKQLANRNFSQSTREIRQKPRH